MFGEILNSFFTMTVIFLNEAVKQVYQFEVWNMKTQYYSINLKISLVSVVKYLKSTLRFCNSACNITVTGRIQVQNFSFLKFLFL